MSRREGAGVEDGRNPKRNTSGWRGEERSVSRLCVVFCPLSPLSPRASPLVSPTHAISHIARGVAMCSVQPE